MTSTCLPDPLNKTNYKQQQQEVVQGQHGNISMTRVLTYVKYLAVSGLG